MNDRTALQLPAVGTPLEGGFFVGAILLSDGPYGLVKAPKALGEFKNIAWGPWDQDVPGARSLVDGVVNTIAMADSGCVLARKIIDLKIDGKQDWHLPALDELEVIYRNCKPTSDENTGYMRSGINLHALVPTNPYMPTDPAQTAMEIFRAGGAEAFETDDPYWTSTPYAGDSSSAWSQWFSDGYQSYWLKGLKDRACAVRRFKI